MENTEKLKILMYHGFEPHIHKEKFEFELPAQKELIQKTILSWLNKYGKSASGIAIHKNEYWDVCHTAQGKVDSKFYFKHKIKYHPFMKELV